MLRNGCEFDIPDAESEPVACVAFGLVDRPEGPDMVYL